VADKTFLISIGDRTLGGLICRDQMVGPWQVPVADCAVTAATFNVYTGEAMAMGERTPVAVNNAAAAARLAVGEALTNLAAAQIGDLGKVNLSANWMAAPAVPGDAEDLYAAVQAVGMELCPALGITIPVGKDSMSMSTVWQDGDQQKRITAPVSLIVSAFAACADVRLTLTPQLLGGTGVPPVSLANTDHGRDARATIEDTILLLIDLGRGKNRLGGSILAQVVSQMGEETPDVDSAADLKNFWNAIQQLGRERKLLAYHDRSDGGLLATAVEMAFAGHVGVDLELPAASEVETPNAKSQTPNSEPQAPGTKDQVTSDKAQGPITNHQSPIPTHQSPVSSHQSRVSASSSSADGASATSSVSSCKNESAYAALFSEELGAVIQVRTADLDSVFAVLRAHGLDTCTARIGALNREHAVRVRQGGALLLDENLFALRAIWSDVTRRISLLRDNPACAEQEYQWKLDPADPGITPVITFDLLKLASLPDEGGRARPLGAPSTTDGPVVRPYRQADLREPIITNEAKSDPGHSAASPLGTWPLEFGISQNRPPVAILREQGVNGEVEMAAAFTRAGFKAVDVHMTDILSGRVSLKDFRGLAACGGFSYGDVLGAGEGWAKSILFNELARTEFAAFFARQDTFALGVCNGCQMLSNLHSIIPGAGHWPRFVQNQSGRYEARFISLKIERSPSVLFASMEGSVIPIPTAHGEGYAEFKDAAAAQACSASGLVCARFVDNKQALALAQSRRSPSGEGGQALAQSRRSPPGEGGQALESRNAVGAQSRCALPDTDPVYTEQYPLNANGSPLGMTAFTTTDGRVTILMPHPERVFRTTAMSYHPADWGEDSPWMKLFYNARAWVG
jgi:phosphoribosylformylglycinamidine synthase